MATHRYGLGLITAAACLMLVGSANAAPIVIDFEGFQTGEVIAGELPAGGNNPGTALPGITLSVQNTGGGPSSLLVFDSSNPSGDDLDLGTPNQDFSGPGVGNGGRAGTQGENAVGLGNILIVAENLVDGNNDDLVDDPDDEAGGGIITVVFSEPVLFMSQTFIDIEETGGTVDLFLGPDTVANLTIEALGNNSAQTVSYSQLGQVNRVVIQMTGSGAVGEFSYDLITPVEPATWGTIKSIYK